MASEPNRRAARARFVLGVVLSGMNEDGGAVELFRSALEYDPALVAARVHLGLAYGRAGAYEEMLGAFREAVRRDSSSVRVALVEQPEEVALIDRMLDPQPTAPGMRLAVMPAEYAQAGDLVGEGVEHLANGRDDEAIEVLERSLRIDPEFPLAISLLSLTYLLLRERGEVVSVDSNASVLFEIDAELAGLIFN